jgi:hypothetical protein
MRPANVRMASQLMPASLGAPGPGLTTIVRGASASMSATAAASGQREHVSWAGQGVA